MSVQSIIQGKSLDREEEVLIWWTDFRYLCNWVFYLVSAQLGMSTVKHLKLLNSSDELLLVDLQDLVHKITEH